jgi:hypothetical protein
MAPLVCSGCGKESEYIILNGKQYILPPGWSTDFEAVEYNPEYARITLLCPNCSSIKDIIE